MNAIIDLNTSRGCIEATIRAESHHEARELVNKYMADVNDDNTLTVTFGDVVLKAKFARFALPKKFLGFVSFFGVLA